MLEGYSTCNITMVHALDMNGYGPYMISMSEEEVHKKHNSRISFVLIQYKYNPSAPQAPEVK